MNIDQLIGLLMENTTYVTTRRSQTPPRRKPCLGVFVVCHHGLPAVPIYAILPSSEENQTRVAHRLDGQMRIPPFAFRLLYHLRRAYWRIVKPTIYGVKALIIHPVDADRVLLVRHSYGDQSLWRLPGGGYRPARETPQQAARRECIEELGVQLDSSALVLEERVTTNGGKRGYLAVVRLHATSTELNPNGEISQARWVAVDLTDLPNDSAVSTGVHSALERHRS
ncbi:NUDIX domain-containing protein [Micromonospora sp. NPDC049204]|uniref:NUDIX domain-containing protein n=1 Tax=Micromonospora sp. NPDC049204 TaxID=3154351 RepID=UPI00340A55BD